MYSVEKIRKYLDGELSGWELESFENEIKNSSSLKREIDTYKNVISEFKKMEKVKIEEEYFINILPRFREKLDKPKLLLFKPSFAAGSIVIIIAAVLFFLLNNNQEEILKEQITLQPLNKEELNEYFKDYTRDITTTQFIEVIPEDYDSLFGFMMGNELNLEDYSGDYFVDMKSNEFNNIIDELSEEEIEGIYNSIINKELN